MHPDQLLLTQPHLPPGDDADTLRLLELAAVQTGATWAILELQQNDRDETVCFIRGSPDGDGTEIELPLQRGWSATLRCGCAELPDAGLVELLAFALARTLQARMLRGQAVLLRGALDTTSNAVLLFDHRGDILYANPPADRLLSRQTEDSLVVELREEQPQPLFTLLCTEVDKIANRADTEPAWHGTLAVSDGSMLGCEILRMQSPHRDQRPNVLAILQGVNTLPDRQLSAFAASYQLTRREEEVLRQLLEGQKTNEMAEQLGISPHTVRDHLKKLYRKTDTSSRSELLNLVTRATAAPTS